MVIFVAISECDSDTGGDNGDNEGNEKMDYHDSVEGLLVFTHFVDVLAQVHNELRFNTSVYNQGDNVARVLNKRATVQELIQIDILLEFWLIRKASL